MWVEPLPYNFFLGEPRFFPVPFPRSPPPARSAKLAMAHAFRVCAAYRRSQAGHSTLPAQRFRRLRGGIFGWEHRGGKVAMALTHGAGANADLEERLKHAEPVKDLETIDVN